jgi:DNA helicase-4
LKLANTKWGARLTFSSLATASIDADGLTVDVAGKPSTWPYLAIGKVSNTGGVVWASIVIELTDGTSVKLDGFDKEQAKRWTFSFLGTHLHQVALAAAEADEAFMAWASEVQTRLPRQWHASTLAHVLAKESPISRLPCGYSYQEIADHPALEGACAGAKRVPPAKLPQRIASMLSQLNDQHFEAHRNHPLFDTLESMPLTAEQRLAVICFDTNLQLIAAAGSGKTATMVAKAAYAITMGIVQPEEVLMLAFNADAAEELAERAAKRMAHLAGADRVTCSTFHGFGLSIIGSVTGAKPRPAAWLEGGQDIRKVVEIMEELSEQDRGFRVDLMLLRTVFATPIGDEGSRGEAGAELMTCRGELVKSREEQLIADWLYFNGVNYEYEAPYPFDTADATHSAYHPDFYYPDADLFHEHFALDAAGNPPPHFKDYAAGVEWKRALHAEKETALVETTSHSLRSGAGLKDLEAALVARGVKLSPNPDMEPKGRPALEYEALARILRTLMQHAKGNRLPAEELARRAVETDPLRGPLLIKIYAKVLERWEAALKAAKAVDFDDMLNLAIDFAEQGRYQSPYRLVIADEAQDNSYARARLLRAVTGREGTFLTCVGDDWQAINGFAGADISVMRNFKEFYGSGTVLYLSRTFRCPEQICQTSSDFVQQNTSQIPKMVTTTNQVEGNAIQCIACANQEEMAQVLQRQLQRIASKLNAVWDSPRKPTIMLLGRYRTDRPTNLAELQRACGPGVELTFSTVHSSKGTEADYVFILNMVRGRKGFPSEIEDDPILQVAMPAPEPFPHASERRLFYVALTRAKRAAFILTIAGKESPFLQELRKKGQLSIVDAQGGQVEYRPCPSCSDGYRTLKTGKFGPYFGCTNFPGCRWTAKVPEATA